MLPLTLIVRKYTPILLLVLTLGLTAAETASAYWIWSPDIGKWINPKKSAKDTPEEQFEWAMSFYQSKDWDRAIEEFEKLPGAFPNSKLSAEGVYYAGLAWKEKNDIAKASDSFMKLIDRYPYSDRIKDAVEQEFDIASRFAAGAKIKVLGVSALPGTEKALEIYRHIVKNAPFGDFGARAQFQIGEVNKSIGEYLEAQKAFQAVVDEYPTSELVTQARYQIAYCSMQASKQHRYDEQATDRAIQEFEGFKNLSPDSQAAVEADESIKALRAKKAESNFEIASFYERQKKWMSAKVYYQEITDQYPDAPIAPQAQERLVRVLEKIK